MIGKKIKTCTDAKQRVNVSGVGHYGIKNCQTHAYDIAIATTNLRAPCRSKSSCRLG